MLRGIGERPVLAVLVGAVAIAFSGVLFRLAHVSPSTGAFYRCVFALPPLWLLARMETRRFGRPARHAVLLAWLAGAFFAADLILWHNAIEQVGAGLATVLGNTQVILVGLLAWALLGERPHRSSLAAIPIVGFGVVLISGALERGAYGSNPGLGAVYGVLTGIAYSGFLLALREGGRDLRRPAGPLFTATFASALGCAAIGAVVGDLDVTPSRAALGWLLLLGRIAPGTELRQAIDDVIRSREGALIVIGDPGELSFLFSGGMRLDQPFTPQFLYELAKMDGAIIVTPTLTKIAYANVQLMPDPTIPSNETGTRHRTAERVAKQTGALVISISQQRETVTVFIGQSRSQLDPIADGLAKTTEALATLETYRPRLDQVLTRLTAPEV